MRARACVMCVFGLLGLFGIAVSGGNSTAAEADFQPIFDGKALTGWDGNPDFWRVENGAIVGETTKEKPTKGNTFLVYRGGVYDDFELKLEFKIHAHNSGVQVRSWEEPEKWGKWVIGGYQPDIDYANNWTGTIYGERYRGVLARRGQITVIGEDHKPKVTSTIGDPAELAKKIKKDDWNEYHIVCQGTQITASINGQLMSQLIDDDPQMRRTNGLIALQLHAGPPMKVEFRNIRLKVLPKAADSMKTISLSRKKIVFIAGRDSHGYFSHAHSAGSKLLAKWIATAYPQVETVVFLGGFPKEPDALAGADAVVLFSDGGGGNPLVMNMNAMEKLIKQGVGLGCIHYAVEIPKGEQGDKLKEWIGGYFETHWSVNPHWKAEFKEFPRHPVANGLRPFAIDDEWYYHMRFVDNMEGVTPILSAVPPESTRQRPDGPHSGNPVVRQRTGMAEHVCWVRQRPDGGRGFGFTGGHWHQNWAHPMFRKVVLNAIAWIAQLDIPPDGVPSSTPTLEELEANHARPAPENFDRERIRRQIAGWNKAAE